MNVIEARNLTKIYRLYSSPKDRLKEIFNLSGKKYHREFYSLNNISFDIKKGETVGIIGQNGSGKSTLLQVICGVLQQTSGSISVNGRIAALLELGAGFNPEFTGRENIYMHGALMGFSRKEMDRRLPEIAAFAEIGEFIYQPVKTYSSGMFVRLAFAAAIHVDPDILIVDEALSVGDMYFQEKCIEKMKSFRKEGRTILFVSHSLPSIRNFCDVGIWLCEGKVVEINEASLLCDKYQEFMRAKIHGQVKQNSVIEFHSESAEIISIDLNRGSIITNEELIFTIHYRVMKKLSGISLAVSISNEQGDLVTLYNTARDDFHSLPFTLGEHIVKLAIPDSDFLSGKYYMSAFLGDEIPIITYSKIEQGKSYVVQTPKSKNGLPIAEGMFRSKHFWKVIV